MAEGTETGQLLWFGATIIWRQITNRCREEVGVERGLRSHRLADAIGADGPLVDPTGQRRDVLLVTTRVDNLTPAGHSPHSAKYQRITDTFNAYFGVES